MIFFKFLLDSFKFLLENVVFMVDFKKKIGVSFLKNYSSSCVCECKCVIKLCYHRYVRPKGQVMSSASSEIFGRSKSFEIFGSI